MIFRVYLLSDSKSFVHVWRTAETSKSIQDCVKTQVTQRRDVGPTLRQRCLDDVSQPGYTVVSIMGIIGFAVRRGALDQSQDLTKLKQHTALDPFLGISSEKLGLLLFHFYHCYLRRPASLLFSPLHLHVFGVHFYVFRICFCQIEKKSNLPSNSFLGVFQFRQNPISLSIACTALGICIMFVSKEIPYLERMLISFRCDSDHIFFAIWIFSRYFRFAHFGYHQNFVI